MRLPTGLPSLTGPNSRAALPPTPQEVVQTLTKAAIFLVATINPGGRETVRSICGDLPGLLRAVGFRDIEGDLSCVMGIGSDAWDALFGQERPAELHPFREIKAGARYAIATPGDLLFHIRAKRMDLCFELAKQIMIKLGDAVSVVDEVHGFRYFDDRDLIGFVDGTENPTAQLAVETAYIGSEDPRFAGGSYVVVQKYLHDLTGWNALSTEAQELIIGRKKLSDIELDDAVKPTSAHNALTMRSSARTSSATRVLREPSSRCLRTCSWDVRPETTTGCSISASPRPAICFSCRPRPSSKRLETAPMALSGGAT
jgi:putative iron-dependent peroxidase